MGIIIFTFKQTNKQAEENLFFMTQTEIMFMDKVMFKFYSCYV